MCRSARSQGCASAQPGQTCLVHIRSTKLRVSRVGPGLQGQLQVELHQKVSDLGPLPKLPEFLHCIL